MSSAVVFVLVCCMNAKKTLHKACLTALHVICQTHFLWNGVVLGFFQGGCIWKIHFVFWGKNSLFLMKK